MILLTSNLCNLLGTNSKFEDFGATFAKDDVIGAYVDLESDPIQISFTKNGESQGTAFEVAKSELEGKALFPHIWCVPKLSSKKLIKFFFIFFRLSLIIES